MQNGQKKEGRADSGAKAASDPFSFPSRQDFLRLRPEEQAEILTRVVSGNRIDFFMRFLAVVDVFEICRGKLLSETFFAAITENTDFLDQCIKTFILGISVEQLQQIIANNLQHPFEDFLRALEANKPRGAISADPPDSVSPNTLTIMLGMQARRNPWQYLYQQNLSALSWMQLGWRMIVDRTPESDYEGIAFIHENTHRIVVVDEQTNPAGLAAQSFVTSLVGSYKGYAFISTRENRACLVAAKIAYEKGQQVFLCEQEFAFLETLQLKDFDFRITNIQTDRECSIQAWLTKLRKNIVYLPTDFPVNVLCSAVHTQWSAAKVKTFQRIVICSLEALIPFKTPEGFNVQLYFESIDYKGQPEQFLLIITPDIKQNPEFCKTLLEYPWSIIILAHDSEGLRTLALPELNQYAFYRYCDRTAQALIGGGLITPEEPLEPDEDAPELTQASVEQQSLEAMVMSRFLRQKKRDVSGVTTLIELANLVIANSGLAVETLDILASIAYQSVLKHSYLLDLSSLTPDQQGLLRDSGLFKFNSGAAGYECISQAVYWLLASRDALKHLDQVSEKVSSNTFCARLLPFLYSQANQENKNQDFIKKLLLRDDLPLEVKARCYEFFRMLYEESIVVTFFIEHPEYRRYLPFGVLEKYHDKINLSADQEQAAATSSAAAQGGSGHASSASASSSASSGASGASFPTFRPGFFKSPDRDVVLDTRDVQLYLGIKIDGQFGGYRTAPGKALPTYFLNNIQEENGQPHFVAVLPSAETSAALAGAPVVSVDRYLSAAQHEEPLFLRCLRAIGLYFDDLKKKPKETLPESICSTLKPFLEKGESLDEGIVNALRDKIVECADVKKMKSEIQTLEKTEAAVDVFTELKDYTNFFNPPAAGASAAKWCVPTNLKILFPFNLGNLHWVSVEIKIHKVGHIYQCSTCLHDPLSPNNCLGESFGLINSALHKRLKECDPKARVIVENIQSPYIKRQHDIVNCGLYAVLDILERIEGKHLQPYTKSGTELRRQMITDLETAAEAARGTGETTRAEALQACIKTNQARMQKLSPQSGNGVTPGPTV